MSRKPNYLVGRLQRSKWTLRRSRVKGPPSLAWPGSLPMLHCNDNFYCAVLGETGGISR